MTRNLPWLVDHGIRERKTNERAASNHGPKQPNHDEEESQGAADDVDERTHRHRRALHAPYTERAPSSSPPPVQPPNPSPLRPSLQADDIYIMVEDEFLAIAQTFTRHLHQAEYQRLQKAVRQRDPSSLQRIRPTDGVTRMRGELKRRKLAESLARKSKKGVDDMVATNSPKYADSESDFNEDEMDLDDQPWQGTALQKFMKTGGRDQWRSLAGLQGPVTHTRNAAGFCSSSSIVSHNEPKLVMAFSKDGEDTDDLEVPVESRSTTSFAKPHTSPKDWNRTSHSASAKSRSIHTDVATVDQRPTSSARIKQSSEASNNAISLSKEHTPTAVRERMKARREQSSFKAGVTKFPGPSAEEIPMFIV